MVTLLPNHKWDPERGWEGWETWACSRWCEEGGSPQRSLQSIIDYAVRWHYQLMVLPTH